ncbi:hypothetical protein [Hymenobacter koreensis]|uniref:Uncharacterized protein n=1 Tax=Hymenobacter koreensis TaxID=1084523 RepID=A0ABP8IW36_9BACT
MAKPSTSVFNQFPPDFFERLAPCMNLCGMACMQLFTRPTDPLPMEVTALTGLDLMQTRLISAINSTEALERQFLEAPHLLYAYLLVGRLALESPLAQPIMRYLRQDVDFDEQQVEALHTHTLSFGAVLMEAVSKFMDQEEGDDPDLMRLQVEGLFARLADTLTVVDVMQELALQAAEPEEEPVLDMGFLEAQLHMIRLSVSITKLLPLLTRHPFAQALPGLSACPAAALDDMSARLQAAAPEEPISFTLPDLLLLYQATQVLAMALVSNVLDILHWQKAMAEPDAAEDAPAPFTADDFSRSQEIICSMIAGFVEFVQENFEDEPGMNEAREEVVALADLL